MVTTEVSTRPDQAVDAPAVVMIMVTHDAGEWFEESLASVAGQDYPNLTVLVIDAGSRESPLSRVAPILPTAFVHSLGDNPGFGAAANSALGMVEGADFYLLCHDDIAMDRNAVRLLVEEAFRSNAGVVGPKLVAWSAPEQLVDVGQSADKTGVITRLVETGGERDQEQHDMVRDVFLVPGACTLVRADLFEEMNGYDPEISFLGDDLDLCWRAQVAGARVIVAPAAKAKHREALSERRPHDDRRRLLARHRLRSVLICYGSFHLLRVLPQAALVTVAEASYALVSGRFDQARDVLCAWTWNAKRLGDVKHRRQLVKRHRRFSDRQVRRLQVKGSARLMSYARGELNSRAPVHSLVGVGRGLTESLTAPSKRPAILVWTVLALILMAGGRDLWGDELPAVSGLAAFDTGPLELLRHYLSGWRDVGLGREGPAPTGIALLGLAGASFFGAMGLLRALLVLGAVPVGLLGLWRLTKPLGSVRAQAVGLLLYAAVPLPFAALAGGHWDALIVYATFPWLLRRLFACMGEEPFHTRSPAWRRLLALGILLAVTAAFVPLTVVFLVVVALATSLGAAIGGTIRPALRVILASLGAGLIAVVLNLPWSFQLLREWDWTALAGVGVLGGSDASVAELTRFSTGPAYGTWLGWAVPFTAGFALLIGRGWRLTWAIRTWMVAVAAWASAWLGGQGLVDLPGDEALLVPAAAALAVSGAMGIVAFERDVSGYHFGWRQVAPLVATGAVVLAALPLVGRSLDGRYEVPDDDFARALSFMAEEEVADDGAFRVLWVGRAAALPLAGQRLTDQLSFALSDSGPPGLEDRFATAPLPAASLVAEALELAALDQTARLGRALAPFGIRFLALPERASPEGSGRESLALPAGLPLALAQQLDLRRLPIDPALLVYENTAWVPVRAQLDPAVADEVARAARPLPLAVGIDLSGSTAVLEDEDGDGQDRYEGEVEQGTVYVATPWSARWRLIVEGTESAHGQGFGWANLYTVPEDGQATLEYETSWWHRLAVGAQGLAWIVALFLAVRKARQ